MRIVVCMKQVLDPEAPVSTFKIDSEVKKVVSLGGTPPVLNPFDENALEAALRIKDTHGAEIIVMSVGQKLAQPVVKKALAAGADSLILLEDNKFEELDSYSTAGILAAGIKKMAEYDLIFCGRQAADTDAGQVGSGVAEILGIPSITIARKIEVNQGKIIVERVISDGYQVVEAPLPALVTFSSELGELRSPTMTAILAARKKEVTIWNAEELGVNPSDIKRTKIIRLYQPVHEGHCEFIEGVTVEEAAVKLALKLREEKII